MHVNKNGLVDEIYEDRPDYSTIVRGTDGHIIRVNPPQPMPSLPLLVPPKSFELPQPAP